jgi:hypothetical protein
MTLFVVIPRSGTTLFYNLGRSIFSIRTIPLSRFSNGMNNGICSNLAVSWNTFLSLNLIRGNIFRKIVWKLGESYFQNNNTAGQAIGKNAMQNVLTTVRCSFAFLYKIYHFMEGSQSRLLMISRRVRIAEAMMSFQLMNFDILLASQRFGQLADIKRCFRLREK